MLNIWRFPKSIAGRTKSRPGPHAARVFEAPTLHLCFQCTICRILYIIFSVYNQMFRFNLTNVHKSMFLQYEYDFTSSHTMETGSNFVQWEETTQVFNSRATYGEEWVLTSHFDKLNLKTGHHLVCMSVCTIFSILLVFSRLLFCLFRRFSDCFAVISFCTVQISTFRCTFISHFLSVGKWFTST